jgi:hypothetical protein
MKEVKKDQFFGFLKFKNKIYKSCHATTLNRSFGKP